MLSYKHIDWKLAYCLQEIILIVNQSNPSLIVILISHQRYILLEFTFILMIMQRQENSYKINTN